MHEPGELTEDGHAERLAGRLALVTGAAGNIGRASAVDLARHGARLVLSDRPGAASGLAETQRLCASANPAVEHVIAPFDVTDAAAVSTALGEVASTAGAPTLVLNNAGYQGDFGSVIDYDLADLETVLRVNVAGVFHVLQASAQLLRAAGSGGAIVNTASMAGVSGPPNMPAYAASKAAVIGLTKSAAKDLAPLGIRVNAISPAFIGPGDMWDNQVARQAAVKSQYFADTEAEVAAQMIASIPLRRYGSLEEVASVARFLLSDDASYLTGVNVEISGGAA